MRYLHCTCTVVSQRRDSALGPFVAQSCEASGCWVDHDSRRGLRRCTPLSPKVLGPMSEKEEVATKIAACVCFVISFVALCMACCMHKSVEVGAACIEVACETIFEMPSLLLLPILKAASRCGGETSRRVRPISASIVPGSPKSVAGSAALDSVVAGFGRVRFDLGRVRPKLAWISAGCWPHAGDRLAVPSKLRAGQICLLFRRLLAWFGQVRGGLDHVWGALGHPRAVLDLWWFWGQTPGQSRARPALGRVRQRSAWVRPE